MKLHHVLLLALFPLAALATPSDPVGALRLRLRGGSDTMVSLPLHRPALIEAQLSARSGNQFTLAATVPALPSSGAYVLIMSGTLEGAVLPVSSATGSTVTLATSGYDLTALVTGSSGDSVAVIPYWTLDTLFPGGANIYTSPSKLSARTQVLLYDPTLAGTSQAPSLVYFYFAGNGTYAAGWYRFGDMTALRGGTVLPPMRPFLVRHPTGVSDTELLVSGAVPLAGYRVPVATLRAATTQDNLVALPVPVPITLAASRLRESGAFAASASRLSPTDQLLLYDNATAAQNKAPSATYFYFAGNGTYAAGWYRFGDMSQSAANLILRPGEGWIIRKYATTTPEARDWSALPSYLQ
ncbi:MAG: TIGR02597 family protein [Verrucomicrobia bacterium]|nr:TIGR02597 family protein [Verrucomicrobiota bacterium]